MKGLICAILITGLFTMSLYPGDAGQNSSKKKFQIEVYGGAALLSPKDFNQLAVTDAQTRDFIYGGSYDFLQNIGSIQSWSRENDGDYRKINIGIPWGARLKYYLSSSFSLSLGVRSIAVGRDSTPSFRYTKNYWDGSTDLDRRDYESYTLYVRGIAPLLGLHLEKKIGGKTSIEGYVAAGPLFARCRYVSRWQAELLDVTGGSNVLLFRETGGLEEDGSGTGLAIDTGLRLNIALKRRFGFFLGLGYVYQSASNISGNGSEIRNGTLQQWQGDWAMKNEELASWWGSQPLHFPTNFWPDGSDNFRNGDFKLDLSGFKLQAGFYFRL